MRYRYIIYSLLLPVLLESSTSIRDAVSKTLLHNPEILSYQKNNKATRLYIDEAKGSYLPTVDLEMSYTDMQTHEKETNNDIENIGPETSLTVSQTLYDGNQNYNTILEQKHNYNETFYKNKQSIEDIVLNAINAYLDLKQSEEMILISKDNIAEHERILEIAKENEDISGEIIDRLQAESKTVSAYNQLKKEEENNKKASSEYFKIVGENPNGFICRPNIRESLIPSDLSSAINESIQKNLEIKQQLQAIYKQRAILSREKSRFLPTILASFSASKDKDITTDEVTSTIYTSSITLSYNLFNGTQDINSYEREKIFLYESQKKLDGVTKSVEDQIKQNFNAFKISKKRIENLKKFVELKKEILKIYLDQFEGGTRTVIDLLAEANELFNASRELINEEFQQMKNYYTMLSLYGDLSDLILDDTKQVCLEEKHEGLFAFTKQDDQLNLDDELAGLLGDTTMDDSLDGLLEESNTNLQNFEQEETQNVNNTDDVVDKMLEKLLAEAYKNDEKAYVVVDDDSIKIKPKVIGSENFKDKFLSAPAEYYTINVVAFGSMEKASQFIEENMMNNNSFAFKYGKELNLFKVVYGVFETYEEAKYRLDLLSFPDKYYPIIEKIGKKQKLYKKYNMDYTPPLQEIDETIPDKQELKDEAPISYPAIENNNNFKEKFLTADKEKFTINVYTFLSQSLAKDFVTNNSLYDNSFLFRFGSNKKLIKLVYGVYDTITEANIDLAKIKTIGDNVYPVVEKIYKQRDIYKRFYNIDEELELAKSNLNSIDSNIKTSNDKNSKELLSSDFLNGSPDNFTINLATISSIDKARLFVDRFKLLDKAIVYRFGENKRYTKVLYGVFKTYEEAVKTMSKFDTELLVNRPHIEKIKKHQELFKKYSEE